MAGLTKIKSGGISPGCDLDGSGTLVLDSTNNRVGIGTSSPTHPLHIDADVDQLRLSDGSGGFDIRAGNILKISDDGTERIRIDSSGNVGIGTTSPSQILELKTTEPRLCLNATSASADLGIEFEANGSRQGHIFHNHTSGEFAVSCGENTSGSHFMTFKTGNGSERMRITSGGFVGIGSTNPTATLQVTGPNTSARGQLTLAGSDGGAGTDARLTFYRGTDFIGAIMGNSDHINLATESGHHIEFSPAGSEKMRITTAGNVGIGTTSPDARLDISVTGAANGSTTDTLILNNDNSNTGDNLATRIRFSRSGNSSSNVYTALDSVRTGTHNTDFVVSVNDGGTLNEEFRVQSTGGISFNGDTATANALDDYEEGTWTPTLSGSTTAGTTSGNLFGDYIKIGKMVYITFRMNAVSHSGSSGPVKIGGLPFPAANTTPYSATAAGMMHNVSWVSGRIPCWYASAGSALYGIASVNGGAWVDWDSSHFHASNLYNNQFLCYMAAT